MEPAQGVAKAPSLPSAHALLKKAGAFYKAHWRKFSTMGSVYACIAFIPLLLAYVYQAGEKDTATTALFTALMLVAQIIGVIFSVALHPAFIGAIGKLDEGSSLTAREAYKFGFGLFFPVIWLSLLSTAAIGGGMVLLLIPGMILSGYFIFSSFALVLDGERGIAALSSSWHKVKGNWLDVFGKGFYFGLVWGLTSVVLIGAYYLLSFAFVGNWQDAGAFISKDSVGAPKLIYTMLASLFSACVYIPVSYAYLYFIYKELKAMKPSSTDTAEAQASRRTWIKGWAIFFLAVIFLLPLFLAAFKSGLAMGK